MQIALPELHSPATLILDAGNCVSEEDYLAICDANPDLRLERTAKGEIVILPPAGVESDYRSVEVIGQLRDWARSTRRGKAFGSSVEFLLPDGAASSPDAAWVSNAQLASLSKAERRQFPRVCPEFVVEVLSPSDRLPAAQRKMNDWLANGVELGWLIDGDARCVYVYRRGCETRVVTGVGRISGEGPLAGFVLELAEIWEGL
jgi:Uma2 family endonuclease